MHWTHASNNSGKTKLYIFARVKAKHSRKDRKAAENDLSVREAFWT